MAMNQAPHPTPKPSRPLTPAMVTIRVAVTLQGTALSLPPPLPPRFLPSQVALQIPMPFRTDFLTQPK